MVTLKLGHGHQNIIIHKGPQNIVSVRSKSGHGFRRLNVVQIRLRVLSVLCSLVVTCWERANLLALLYVMFYKVFVTFYLYSSLFFIDLSLKTWSMLPKSNNFL